MTPQMWWWEYDMRVEENKRVNKMIEGGDKFSGDDWDKARRVHREKMKARADGVSTD